MKKKKKSQSQSQEILLQVTWIITIISVICLMTSFATISFLPFESAVQTTLLSTRWKDALGEMIYNEPMEDAVLVISRFVKKIVSSTNQENNGVSDLTFAKVESFVCSYYRLRLEDAMLDFRQGPGNKYCNNIGPGLELIVGSVEILDVSPFNHEKLLASLLLPEGALVDRLFNRKSQCSYLTWLSVTIYYFLGKTLCNY
ncbi:hypothetical protein REPUB_Repub13aG0073600 [Reevesia pubescens]